MTRSTRSWLALTLLAVLPAAVAAQERATGFDHDHAAWTAVLDEHLEGSNLDYAALKKQRAPLDDYLRTLEAVTPEQFAAWERGQRYAFWINAYNAYTVRAVVDAYPVSSITEIGTKEESVWERPFLPLGKLWKPAKGAKLSLDQVEHEILRPEFRDPRVHAAVNCASKGCPPLAAKAFAAETLDAQLDRATRAWLADPAHNRFEPKEKRVRLSRIFEWYGDDFTRGDVTLADWLAEYAPPQYRKFLEQAAFRVEYLEYDWALNEVARS